MYVVVSYDIEDDKRRTRIHKTLKNFGEWVQFSVFECNLTKQQYLKLRDKLDHLIKKEDNDSIRFYFLCEGCVRGVERIGGVKPLEEGAIVV